jgi:fatty acid desaturase
MNQLENNIINESPRRSKLISTIAIIFIVLGGLKSCNSTIMTISYFTTSSQIYSELAKSAYSDDNPYRMFAPLIANSWLLFIGDWIFSVGFFIASIGTLKRKNWARIMLISFILLGIVYLLAFPIVFHLMVSNQPIYYDMERYKTMQVTIVSIVIVLSLLFGWIIKKLFSKNIKNEFIQTQLAG